MEPDPCEEQNDRVAALTARIAEWPEAVERALVYDVDPTGAVGKDVTWNLLAIREAMAIARRTLEGDSP